MTEEIKNSLYKEVIMEHYKNPRNANLVNDLKTYLIKNPVCGDSVNLQIEVEKNVIKNIYHKSIGCSISTSSTSVMSELLKGKTVNDAINIINNYVKMVKGEKYDQKLDFGDAIAYSGVADYPARFKCATISWEAILNILQELKQK